MTAMASRNPSAATDHPVVAMAKVNKHFGALHVLKDINLSISKGEVVVVIGPSGSGKSTLCRTINRLEAIDSGDRPKVGRRMLKPPICDPPNERGARLRPRAEAGTRRPSWCDGVLGDGTPHEHDQIIDIEWLLELVLRTECS